MSTYEFGGGAGDALQSIRVTHQKGREPLGIHSRGCASQSPKELWSELCLVPPSLILTEVWVRARQAMLNYLRASQVQDWKLTKGLAHENV